MLGEGDEKATKFLVHSSVKKGNNGDDVAWERLLRDFDELASGQVGGHVVAPAPGGRAWAFALLFAKSDEETRCLEFGFPSYTGPEPCSECLANRGERPYTDLRPSAAWRATERMPLEYYLARPKEPLHPLARSRYFTDRWFFYLDIMHLMDCRGVAGIVYGSLLALLLRLPALGGTRAERLDTVNAFMVAWYNAHPGTHRLPALRATNLTLDGWAELHGPAIKAANSRAAAPLFFDLAQEYCTEGTDQDTAVLQVTRSLVHFYDLIWQGPMFFDEEQLQRLRAVCLTFGSNFQLLREAARGQGLLAWLVKPKVHKMQHIPLMAEVINPRFVQCYADESLVGTCTKVWQKTARGRYKRTVQKAVLAKRLAALQMRFSL